MLPRCFAVELLKCFVDRETSLSSGAGMGRYEHMNELILECKHLNIYDNATGLFTALGLPEPLS